MKHNQGSNVHKSILTREFQTRWWCSGKLSVSKYRFIACTSCANPTIRSSRSKSTWRRSARKMTQIHWTTSRLKNGVVWKVGVLAHRSHQHVKQVEFSFYIASWFLKVSTCISTSKWSWFHFCDFFYFTLQDFFEVNISNLTWVEMKMMLTNV